MTAQLGHKFSNVLKIQESLEVWADHVDLNLVDTCSEQKHRQYLDKT